MEAKDKRIKKDLTSEAFSDKLSDETKKRLEEIFGKDKDPSNYLIRSNVGIKLVEQKGFLDSIKNNPLSHKLQILSKS